MLEYLPNVVTSDTFPPFSENHELKKKKKKKIMIF